MIFELAQSMKDRQIRDDLSDEQSKQAITEEIEFMHNANVSQFKTNYYSFNFKYFM